MTEEEIRLDERMKIVQFIRKLAYHGDKKKNFAILIITNSLHKLSDFIEKGLYKSPYRIVQTKQK